MALPVALAVFLTSGFAALLYQVIWQRLLAIFSGADVYSATVIVAAFMGGLGVGHLAGGHLADRVSRRTSLALFGAAELGIALFALVSAAFYYGLLYLRLGQLDLRPEAIALILFGSLLWPTCLMGASLPLLARAITDRVERAAFTVGALYGVNTLGAAAGAVVATWVLLPQLGMEGSLRVGAVLNAACAVVVLPLAFGLGSSRTSDRHDAAPGVAATAGAASFPFWAWALVYGFAGFVALSYEIVWFRLLGIMVKSTAFTFGSLLCLYLAGIGIGAVAGSHLAPRLRRPGSAFFLLQAAAGVSAGLLLTVFVALAGEVGAVRSYFGSYEPLNVRDSVHALRMFALAALQVSDTPAAIPANFLRFHVAVPLLLVVPPTFLMGCSFPVLQRIVQTDVGFIGRRVGLLLMANIAGSILGTVLTGWAALSLLGTAATLKLLTAASGVFALGALLENGAAGRASASPADRRIAAPRLHLVGAAATGAAVLAVVVGMPRAPALWARLHGTTVDRIVFAEDNSGLSVIKAEQEGFAGPKTVFVNGMGQSVLPYGGIHTALGALPALVHPDPRDVAIIGLGSGDTLYAAAGRPTVERITCIEIIGPQLATLRDVARRDAYEGLRGLLRDPRIEYVSGDGRAYLMRTMRRFDVIEADALRPTSAYSGNLYSDAYFTLVRERLKPNGLAATWAPTRRIHDTFVKVFPYVASVPGILLGSNEPFAIDHSAVAARLEDPRVRGHYERAGIDIEALVWTYLDGTPATFGPDFDRAGLTDVNSDLFPRDEYDLSPP